MESCHYEPMKKFKVYKRHCGKNAKYTMFPFDWLIEWYKFSQPITRKTKVKPMLSKIIKDHVIIA